MQNKIIIIALTALMSFGQVSGQINESFDDGNFTENPVWTGDTDKFMVQTPLSSGDGSIDPQWQADEFLLQSMPNMGDAVLVTESTRAYGEWLFSVADGKNWRISSTNDFAVIFMSDTNDPALLKDGAQNFNGYYLRFDGSTMHNFVLYRQTGTTSTPLIDSGFPDGEDGTASTAFTIKITREPNGGWNLYIDEGLYTEPTTHRGSATDNEVTTSNYFAFATNIANPSVARVAYIDNIITREPYVDTEPPFVDQVAFTNQQTIKLTLDEISETTTTQNVANYNLTGIGNPQSAIHNGAILTEILLQFDYSFSANEALTLAITGVEDIAGNAMDTTFQFTAPSTLGMSITESFTDGNLTQAPTWTGETDNFEIVSPEIEGDGAFPSNAQHDGFVLRSAPNTTSSAMIFETFRAYGQWSFNIADGSGWEISSTNDFQIILVSDSNEPANLKVGSMNFNGYFLRFDGSTGDVFVLYKQTGTTSTPIITTTFPEYSGTEDDGTTPKPYAVKITRTNDDGWKLYIDETWENEAYTLRGTSTDNEIQSGIYFGVATNISTPSEKRVAYFDNIYAGEIIYDTEPPLLSSIQIKNENTLKLNFNEPLDTLQIGADNFSVASGNPISQITHANYGMNIFLQFQNNFTLLETDTLFISELSDLEGNAIADTSATFTYITATPGDVVINEIFFDTYPPVGLPEYDYLELYNNSGFDINLENWTLTISDDERTFPNVNLPANGYLIITSSSAVIEYENYGQTIGLITTTMLTNTGASIVLQDTLGQIIHSIEYTQDWYGDKDKIDGGWSIEQIDPNAICAMENNWRASVAEIGGTPGSINSVDAENPDNTAPAITDISITTPQSITILLSENIPVTNINSQHISISADLGVLLYEQNPDNKKLWTISTSNEIPERTEISISFTNISDFCGNTLSDTTLRIYRVSPVFQQVVFNEIMAKPAPDDGIQYEYVELVNRDTLPISLQNWQFWVGSRYWTIGNITIEPDEYLLILPEYMAAHPNAPEKAIYFFDEADLTDGGTMLKLTDPDNNIITWVDYDDNWHTNNLHTLGGYALERIDIQHLCGGAENWQTSTATNHGTPGAPNSIAGITTDETLPEALFYIVPQDTTLQVEFDSPIWPDTTIANIAINDVDITQAWIEHPSGNTLTMRLSEPLQPDVTYQMTISQYKDCNMNPMEATQFTFEVPQSPEKNDLIINEVLFNPETGCNDFVELLNISNKYLAIDELNVANATADGYPENIKSISDKRYVLAPNSYYVFTAEYDCLEASYSPVEKKQTILTTLPSMADAEGSIMILDKLGNTIDMLQYTEKMHNSLLTSKDGVSLERVSPLAASDNPSNWVSAAADAGFATPTRQNSNYNNKPITENNISLLSETFSPNGDGFEDYLQINYKFAKGNNIINIRILDHTGRVVRHLINNESVSVEGFVNWDGTDDDQHKQPIGVYIVHSEWYDEDGNLKSDTRTCVLAGELR